MKYLIILLNILGVMIDNKRFVFYCIVTYKCYEMYAHRGKKVQLLVF